MNWKMNKKKSNPRSKFSIYFLPILTALVSIVVYYIPWLTDALQFNREEIFPYKVYLSVTCHFTHWNFRHMFVDTFFF
jgi:hypothetical protein